MLLQRNIPMHLHLLMSGAELKKLSETVEEYEMQKYPMPLQRGITEILEQYIFEKRINKRQLSEELEIPNSTLSEIMNGKKKLILQ